MLIVFLIMVVVSFFFGYYAGKESRPKQKVSETTKTPPPTKSKFSKIKRGHVPPSYYGYKQGSFAHINRCSKCGIIGLYEDLHTAKPCPDCGNEIRRWGAAKWVEVDGVKQWVSNDE